MSKPHIQDFSKCIALRRVVTRDTVNRPRNERDASPGTDRIFDRNPMARGKEVLLWLSQDRKWVYIEDPLSHEVEDVPIENVVQLQRWTDRHEDLLKNPPAAPGLVRSLSNPRAS